MNITLLALAALTADPCAAAFADDEGLAAAALATIPDAATVVTDATTVAAGADLPSYCRVRGVVAVRSGFELRLPVDGWNGRLLMQGCGGLCGIIRIESTDDALARGYAVVTTDMGHRGTPGDASWAYRNLQAEIDFGHRATHVVAVAAKAMVARHYGRGAARSYFRGCSTGGRQGMVAAQRHPEDFDAIIAGAPVLNEIGDATLHLLWSARTNRGSDRRPILDAAKLPALRAAVMSACDAADGVRDDVIEDPRTCRFDPAAMHCAPGRDDTRCLTAAEVGVVRRLYAGAHDAAGRRLFPGGLARGSEYEWAPALIGAEGRAGLIIEQDTLVLSMLRYMVFEPDAAPTYGIHDFDFERDVPRIALTEPLYNAQNPDLRAFRDRGGRLLLYHGWDDLEIPPALTLDYYATATRAMGGPEATRAFFRLFMLPGVAHCRRGPGADAIDWLTVLEHWELEGRAPDAVEAFRLVKPQTYDGLPPVRFPLLPGAASATRAIPVFRVEPTLP